MSAAIAPAQALDLAALGPLPDAWRLVLPYLYQVWLRPEQRIPETGWSYYGFICGRGWGKSLAIAVELNRRVEAGEARRILLMAPNDDRVDEVQLTMLISAAPPWFKPIRYLGGLLWPNGARAISFTPEAPERARGDNADHAWLTELVDWKASTRRAAFDAITSSVRVGRAQVFWDTTSKGRNDVIQFLLDLNESDPRAYPVVRGTTFDNPMLSRKYLAAECRKFPAGTRKHDEEILGKVFQGSAGALWQQAWIDDHRVLHAPLDPALVLVSIDPAKSARSDADETGLVVGARGRNGHAYILEDASGRYPVEVYNDMAVERCIKLRASGVIIERTGLGDHAIAGFRSRAEKRDLQVRVLDKGTKEKPEQPFPPYTEGVIYVRDRHAATSKIDRASGPASEYEKGRAHHVGEFAELEAELTTYEPGTAKSPNRYDADSQLVTELLNLEREAPPVDPAAEMEQGALAYARLQSGLRAAGRGRRIGL